MEESSRRRFLQQLGGAVAAAVHLPAGAQSPVGTTPSSGSPVDLLIAGGRVVDPARGFSGPADVAIVGGRIAQVGPGLPRASARQVIDAGGAIVTPELIDVHGHVYDEGIPTSVDPDLVLNISTIGLVVNNEIYLDPRMIDVAAAVRTIRDHPRVILGIKVRVTGREEDVPRDIEVMKKAREAADTSGVPIMMHWSNDRRLHDLLKRGDVMTHPFNPPRAGPDCLGPGGTVRPEILELRARGGRVPEPLAH